MWHNSISTSVNVCRVRQPLLLPWQRPYVPACQCQKYVSYSSTENCYFSLSSSCQIEGGNTSQLTFKTLGLSNFLALTNPVIAEKQKPISTERSFRGCLFFFQCVTIEAFGSFSIWRRAPTGALYITKRHQSSGSTFVFNFHPAQRLSVTIVTLNCYTINVTHAAHPTQATNKQTQQTKQNISRYMI